MNIDRIINMVIRQVMRRFINKGINTGINAMSKRGKSQPNYDEQSGHNMSAQSKEDAKRARKIARLSQKNSRF